LDDRTLSQLASQGVADPSMWAERYDPTCPSEFYRGYATLLARIGDAFQTNANLAALRQLIDAFDLAIKDLPANERRNGANFALMNIDSYAQQGTVPQISATLAAELTCIAHCFVHNRPTDSEEGGEWGEASDGQRPVRAGAAARHGKRWVPLTQSALPIGVFQDVSREMEQEELARSVSIPVQGDARKRLMRELASDLEVLIAKNGVLYLNITVYNNVLTVSNLGGETCLQLVCDGQDSFRVLDGSNHTSKSVSLRTAARQIVTWIRRLAA